MFGLMKTSTHEAEIAAKDIQILHAKNNAEYWEGEAERERAAKIAAREERDALQAKVDRMTGGLKQNRAREAMPAAVEAEMA